MVLVAVVEPEVAQGPIFLFHSTTESCSFSSDLPRKFCEMMLENFS